jgi:hypothetical protein
VTGKVGTQADLCRLFATPDASQCVVCIWFWHANAHSSLDEGWVEMSNNCFEMRYAHLAPEHKARAVEKLVETSVNQNNITEKLLGAEI